MAALTITGKTLTSKTVICALAGDLGASGFDPLEDEFEKYLNAGVLGIVMDLSGLDSLASSGLGAILNMSRILKERNGRLILASPKPEILGTIEMLGLQEAVPLTANLNDARKLLSGL
jgi:anti-anti-sigma factor